MINNLLDADDADDADFFLSTFIPAYTEEYLGMHYGVNFMFPNKHFDYKKEATNIKYFSIEEMIGYRRNYIS